MPEAMDLNNSTLKSLPIDAPKYDRGDVSVGIAHIGAGHFHRAHQAAYINLLLQQGLAHEWGICGVGVMPADWTMRDVLNDQDGLYTLILENPDGSRDAQVIGESGRPIPGLFAAGESAGGVVGPRYVGSGNSYANCVTFGRVAGASAALRARMGEEGTWGTFRTG